MEPLRKALYGFKKEYYWLFLIRNQLFGTKILATFLENFRDLNANVTLTISICKTRMVKDNQLK